MAPGWIEFGSDRRPYYVRKKTRIPSARELLSGALAPLRKNSSPFSRAYRRDHHFFPAPSNTPLYLPAPHVPPATFTAGPTHPNNKPPSGWNARAMGYTQQSDRKNGSRESDNDGPPGILKPQPQTYPVPHPTMYPAPPQNPMAFQQPPGFGPPPLQTQVPNQMQHISTQPPGAYPSQSLPAGARIISPPRYPTADELKYKCSICGRSRSARYHYKHPLPAGQLPGKTVCRKCREESTDSEESTVSSDSRHDRKHRRQRKYEDEVQDVRRSYSRSSSLDVAPLRSRSRGTRSRYERSPSVEVVRYIERPPRPLLRRLITYVENVRPRREEYFWDEAEEDFEYRPTRRYSRYGFWINLLLTVTEPEDSRDRQHQHRGSSDTESPIEICEPHSLLRTVVIVRIVDHPLTIMRQAVDVDLRHDRFLVADLDDRSMTMSLRAMRGSMMISDETHTDGLDL